MKKIPIYIFIISFFGVSFTAFSQEDTRIDTLIYKEKYGFRLGIDLSKPVRSFIDKNYTGIEINGDYRLTENFYPAAELGHENYTFNENNFTGSSEGQYLKLGVNYNVYKNWIGMQNEIYTGLRYGFSTFTEQLDEYTIYKKDHYFPPDVRESGEKFSGLTAHWIEFRIGLKAEVLNNLFLGVHTEVKRMITDKSPSGFANLWIPGFNERYESTEFGVGWGYSISYMIPFRKKDRKEKQ